MIKITRGARMPVNFTSVSHTPSPREVEEARTPAGGFSKATLAGWGVTWPPRHGWQLQLLRQWAAERGAVEFHSDCPNGGPHDWKNQTPADARAAKIWTCVYCRGLCVTEQPKGHKRRIREAEGKR